MKYKIKRIALILMGLTILLCLAGCAKSGSVKENLDEDTKKEIATVAEKTVSDIAQFDDMSLASAIVSSNSAGNVIVAEGLGSWMDNKSLIGEISSIGEAKVKEIDGGYLATVMIDGSQRDVEVSIGFNKEMSSIIQLSINPIYTIAEKMERAALNTVLGMGTVFIVLIFISILIGLFKYIYIFENKLKENKSNKEDNNTQIKELDNKNSDEQADLTKDTELIAVIMAAIKASENISTDNLVVRSIKRVNKNRR